MNLAEFGQVAQLRLSRLALEAEEQQKRTLLSYHSLVPSPDFNPNSVPPLRLFLSLFLILALPLSVVEKRWRSMGDSLLNHNLTNNLLPLSLNLTQLLPLPHLSRSDWELSLLAQS